MPMTRIEPYRQPCPTIRELVEGRPAGADDGGVPPKGESGEAAQVGLQVGGQGGRPEARDSARDTALARGRPAESTQSRRTTVRGRTRDGREGREERGGGRVTRGRGAHLAWPGTAKGHAP